MESAAGCGGPSMTRARFSTSWFNAPNYRTCDAPALAGMGRRLGNDGVRCRGVRPRPKRLTVVVTSLFKASCRVSEVRCCTEGGGAPGWQGAKSEHVGNM